MVRNGEIVKLININDLTKFYLRKIVKDFTTFEDHRGNRILANDLIGKNYGTIVGNYVVVKPSIEDFILYYWKRKTQIVYPKDAGYIVTKVGELRNKKVLEIATGSGVMSLFWAKSVYPNGKVFSIDKNYSFIKNAYCNIKDFDFTFETDYLSVIKFFVSQDIYFFSSKGSEDSFFDVVFLDVPVFENFVDMVYNYLLSGGYLVSVLPTTNQVVSLIGKIKKGFVDIQVEEIILRKYKVNPDRFRPVDTMVAHTAYIISAKKT
ncbi:MAG: methyltransferase domain-containing protein [bacterium]